MAFFFDVHPTLFLLSVQIFFNFLKLISGASQTVLRMFLTFRIQQERLTDFIILKNVADTQIHIAVAILKMFFFLLFILKFNILHPELFLFDLFI